MAATDAGTPPGRKPAGRGGRPRRVAAALVLVEGLVILAAGIVLSVQTVVGDAVERGAAAFLALMTVGLGVALVSAARGVSLGARWARAPVFLWQILQVGLSPVPGSQRWYVAVPMVLVAVVVGALVLRRDVIDQDER